MHFSCAAGLLFLVCTEQATSNDIMRPKGNKENEAACLIMQLSIKNGI